MNIKNIKNELNALVGETVTLSASSRGIDRQSFGTRISIVGTLEANPQDGDKFRVFVTDETYAYFSTDDVRLVNPLVNCPTVVLGSFVNVAEQRDDDEPDQQDEHPTMVDGFPASDSDPATGVQYGDLT